MTSQLLKGIYSQKNRTMNIAIIGYGRMGHEIEYAAVNRNHAIKLTVDKDNISDLDFIESSGIDVAIEFTTPDTAARNVLTCLRKKVPVVCGTTGWLKDYDTAVHACLESDVSFLYSSNFSIGVNILFRLNAELARLLSAYRDYKPFIEEIHHTKKLDAPSGTAITLAGGITANHPGYTGWSPENEGNENKVPVRAIREGNVPGIHSITWDSEIDSISLRHESKNRKGLALGAVIAAEFIHKRKGIFTMSDVLGF
jgi:4-hydroxy-tetrahydrodipicolinate reductase